MALTSLLGGLALANAKLGAVHGFAGPIGGMYPAPHGVVCARLLPYVIEVNVRALLEREPQNQALARYDEIGQILTGDATASATDAVTWVQELCEALQVPPLSSFGVRPEDLSVLAKKGAVSSSMKGNPIELEPHELRGILAKAL
jgi:alcohol dehydrogenase class IV